MVDKMNIFLVGMPEIHTSIIKQILTLPKVIVEKNFQQVLGMAHAKELKRLCIFMDAWNGEILNGIRGQTAAERIHEESPGIPILIWEGREYLSDENTAPVFKVTGTLKPLKYDNELYLSFNDYENRIFEITKKFFEGSLTISDIPQRECLERN